MDNRITEYTSRIVGNPWKNWLFIRIQTESGIEGYGEASLNGFVTSVERNINELQKYFVGRSVYSVTKIINDMLLKSYSDGGQIHRNAIAAVESACWDIIGKTLNEPIWNLWGGKVRDEIQLYANGWYQTERDPSAFAEKAAMAVSKGYNALKVDPFGDMRGLQDAKELQLSLDIISAIKDAVPGETSLMIEGHCRFDVSSALVLCRKLSDLDIVWFEEPVPFNNMAGLIEIAQRSPVRIATGENFTTFEEFLDLCSGSRNIVFQPDIANLGGLKLAKQICDLGENLGIAVAPHDAQGPISKALCLQLCAMSSAIFIQEDFEEFNPEWTKTISTPIDKTGGKAIIPTSPGLGRDLYWEELELFPYDENATLTLFDQGWERRGGITR